VIRRGLNLASSAGRALELGLAALVRLALGFHDDECAAAEVFGGVQILFGLLGLGCGQLALLLILFGNSNCTE
jgi:hypothetical protein